MAVFGQMACNGRCGPAGDLHTKSVIELSLNSLLDVIVFRPESFGKVTYLGGSFLSSRKAGGKKIPVKILSYVSPGRMIANPA